MKQSLINILASPFFIALVLFAVVFIFIPKDLFIKYKLEQVFYDIPVSAGNIIHCDDLNFDGKSEKTKRYIDNKGMNAMNVYTNKGLIIDQFNLGRKAELTTKLYAFDRDKNGLKEVYTLSHSNDSIFLNWAEPMNNTDNIPQSRFITTMCYNKYGNIDYRVRSFRCADLDNDGNNEILCAINGGYSKFPRKVFAYDFKKDSVFSSPNTGAKCFMHNEVMDINGDGFKEIILRSHGVANIAPNDTVLDDEHSYLMVLDHQLNFLFEPIRFFGFPSSIQVIHVKTNDSYLLYAFFSVTGNSGEPSKIMIFDATGKLLKSVETKEQHFALLRNSDQKQNVFFIYYIRTGQITIYDLGLNIISEQEIGQGLGIIPYCLDNNEKNQWVVKYKDHQTITVFQQDFSHPVSVKLPVASRSKNIFKTGIFKTGEKKLLHIQKDEYEFMFEYGKNLYYYLKFPFYFGVYLVLLLVVFAIQRLTKYQTERKLALEKQISELQLKTIRSQMDPHFTFNALNTISSIIYKEDKEKAHRYFTKFSKLVRATLDASERITRTLGEELDFTENYLMLEKIRFKDKFEYRIKIAENVNKDRLIPKMIIQIYVENAIKHGLKHKEKDGLLKIDISYSKRGRLLPLMIIIEDNGIGRKRAAELETFGTGHGMKIMETIGELYFKLYKIEIKQKIEDLFDEKGNALGTRVVVEVLKKVD